MAEILQDIRNQGQKLFGEMKMHQKVTFVALALMTLIPFSMLIFGGSDGGYEPLQFGAVFDREVLMQAEQALMERGFVEFKTVGQRIMAPASKVDEYNAALLGGGIRSPQALTEFDKTIGSLNPFTPPQQVELMRTNELRKEVRRILRTYDEIHDADVIWARSEGRQRWPSGPVVTASVNVTPRAGRILSPQTINTIRAAVAGMIPDLTEDHVVIVDRSSGRSWSGNNSDSPYDNKLEEHKRSVIDFHQTRIHRELSGMYPGVRVALHIDFDNLVRSQERRQEIDKTPVELTTLDAQKTVSSSDSPAAGVPGTQSNQPRSLTDAQRQSQSQETDRKTATYSAPTVTETVKEYATAAPTSFQVSVSVPEDLIEKLVVASGQTPGTTDEEKAEFAKKVNARRTLVTADIQKFVANLIPAGTPADSITVITHTQIDPEIPPLQTPVMEIAYDIIRDWGSTLALAAFAIWALLLVKKSMPVSQSAPSMQALDKLAEAIKPPEPEEPEEDKRPKTSRDFLQFIAAEDPEAAAAQLTTWSS
jgi:flagellar M-ring protein FliF